ncbi:MAG: DEAD/DEAH box helicase [Flavobacterium sp.]
MELSREQQIAFDKYVQGRNIFITGPGGSGKSELIRRIFTHATLQRKDIYVTALTGCAAVLLNCKAKTLHSWAGIGIGTADINQLIMKISKSRFMRQLWVNTDILVVDEVSMMSLKLFNILNTIGQTIRRNTRPFGGIQLIFSGDFYQLPPVGDYLEPDTQRMCFESDDWNAVFHRDCQIELKKIFRQTDDVYATILNQIREGRIKRSANDLLMTYVGREKDPHLVVEPTKLYPTKNKVEQINFTKMVELTGETRVFKLKHHKDLPMTGEEKRIRSHCTDQEIMLELEFLAGNLMCDKEITLKVGAHVMCIVNICSADKDILVCNGSQGRVTRFCPMTGNPFVLYNNGLEMQMGMHIWPSDKVPGVGVSQVPLILAWALTIHKSQGATLDAAEIDVGSGIFECGQTYVALSRVKSLHGLYLTSFDARRIRINKKVKEYYESLRLYHETNEQHQEVYVPLVIADEIQTVIPAPGTSVSFEQFAYPEADAVELTEEPYRDPTIKEVKF